VAKIGDFVIAEIMTSKTLCRGVWVEDQNNGVIVVDGLTETYFCKKVGIKVVSDNNLSQVEKAHQRNVLAFQKMQRTKK